MILLKNLKLEDIILYNFGGRAGNGGGGASRGWVRKLEDDYFENWPAGTELNREEFKQLIRIELRK